MKTWENWSIDCGDKDESKVVISGSATSLDRVYINFESGADAGNYIVTYNDGIRCITKTYTVAGAPCEIEWLGGTECITCDCICDNLVLNEASANISKDGCSDMAIGSASDCITNIVTTTETWVRVNAVGEGLYLNVDANANSSRSTTVTFDYGVSCDSGKSCTKTLTVNQAGGSCDCGSITYSGTEETDPTVEGLNYFAKIVNNTSSAIDVDDIQFDFDSGTHADREEFHNRQTIPANGNALYNHGNSICLDSCNNNYPSATISNGRITIWEGSSTSGKSVTLDKSTIVNGDTITFTYNG
jgi:hypothetical protein